MPAPCCDGISATASKKLEGAPDSAWSAGSFLPLPVVTPEIFGATIASRAPSFSHEAIAG